MKIEFSAVLLGLLALNVAQAAEVLQLEAYLSKDCSGDPITQATLGFGGQCLKTSTGSVRYSCSEIEVFQNDNCEGDGTKTTVETSCISELLISSKHECKEIPDNEVAKIAVGTSCADGEVSGLLSESFLVLGECSSLSFGEDAQVSFKYSVSNGGLAVTIFTEKNDCTGDSISETIPINDCKMSASASVFIAGRRRLQSEFAVRASSAVEGTTLGGNAMSTSASVFALFVAMIAAFVAMA